MTDDLTPTATTPADVLADGADTTTFGDLHVRKGTVAAFVANARRFDRAQDGSTEHEELRTALVEAVPALRAIGVLDVFAPTSPAIREIVAAATATD